MTPSLFDLPLRLGDAAALAPILFDQLGQKTAPVSAAQRSRIESRAGALAFMAMRPHFGSLERDPVHPSAYYICVDGVEGQPLLLRTATASTPSSGLFPKSILIGRTFVGRTEAVFNVVPFGPEDREAIRTFAAAVNPSFLPKALSVKPAVWITGEATAALARQLQRRREGAGEQIGFTAEDGQDREEFYFAVLWAVIRAGWREGYGIR